MAGAPVRHLHTAVLERIPVLLSSDQMRGGYSGRLTVKCYGGCMGAG
jgi:hypothetical protein